MECPYPIERMKPLVNRAKEGRANPKGIPVLYLSDVKETAISEVRPWVGSIISVALFRVTRQISIIDCTSDSTNPNFYLDDPSPNEIEEMIWGDINKAFSIPIETVDDKSEYVPTQILSECFKANGFDGIAYKSFLGRGLNIALFNLDDALAEKCFLYKVKTLKFEVDDHISPCNSITYETKKP